MHLNANLKSIVTNATKDDQNRIFYVVLFLSFLIFSIITTGLIYYFVRYKKKSFFDASGRKYIEFHGDYNTMVEIFEKIIKDDQKALLEEQIISIIFMNKFILFA